MTVYNRPQVALVNTLNALGKNDLADTEILVVDDGSTALYEPLLAAYKGLVRYERIDTCKDRPAAYNINGLNNPAYANNRAVELAKGETICFMSSDTIIQARTLTMLKSMTLRKIAWMPCVVDVDDFSMFSARGHYLSPARLAPFGWFYATHRANFEAVRWDEEYLNGIAFEDNDFMARLALHVGRFVVDTDCIAFHQSHPPSAYSDGLHGHAINQRYTLKKWGAIPWHPQTGECLEIKQTNVNAQLVLDVTAVEKKVVLA